MIEDVNGIQSLEFTKDRMRTQEVVVGNPEGNGIVGGVEELISAGIAVGRFEGAVETFDHLLEGPEFGGNRVVIGKTDDLSNIEFERILIAQSKLLSGKGVSRITVRNEAEVLRQGFDILKCHAHRHDAGTDTAVIGNPVADNGTGNCIHDEPDVGFDAFDFDVGLVCDKCGGFLGRVGHEKRAHKSSGGSAVVFNRRVRDIDAVNFLESQCCFAQRKP